MEETNKSFSLEENYYDAFQFSDLSQSTIEADNNGGIQYSSFNSTIENGPTIVLDPPDESDAMMPNLFMRPLHLQSNSNSNGILFHQQYDHDDDDDVQFKSNHSQNNDENEIKSELIKSELNDINSANPNTNVNTLPNHLNSSENQISSNKSSENVTRNSHNYQKCYKCENCPFISTSMENLEIHKENCCNPNNTSNEKFKCPGCENIHHARTSLEIHLKLDHKMLENEIQPLLDYVCREIMGNESINGNDSVPKKSRIYLKNVEVLKDLRPERDCSNQIRNNEIHNISEDSICTLGDHDQTLDNNLTFIDLVSGCNQKSMSPILPPSAIAPTTATATTSSQKPLQQQNKISIKSVDVLREPSLNSNQHLLHSLHHHSDSMDVTENFNCSPAPLTTEKTYYDLDTGFTNNFHENTDTLSLEQPHTIPKETFNNHEMNKERPRRAKIYIKNVDILKEPIFVPPPNSLSNILDVNDDLRLNLLSMDHQRAGPSFVVPPPPSTQPPVLPSSSLLDNMAPSSQFPITNEIHLNTHYRGVDHAMNSRPRSKISIKNVDILKEPCLPLDLPQNPIQEFPPPRKFMTSSLHLRTVDELNLMNTNEVQNLITPVLDQNFVDNNSQGDTMNPSSENSKNSDEIGMIIADYRGGDISTDLHYDHQSSQNAVGIGFDPNSYSILNDHKNMRNFELNTPQRPEVIDDDDDENVDGVTNFRANEKEREEEDEGDILFVCVQEIVNQNEKTTLEKEVMNFTIPIESQQDQDVVEIFDDMEKQQQNQPNQLEERQQQQQQNNGVDAVGSKEGNNDGPEKRKVKRGRPFGARQTGITKMRKLYGNTVSESKFFKCDFMDCALRFKKSDTLSIHKKCHVSDSSQQRQCPECSKNDFSSWNTLHTHLWRCHQIDMELYSCDMCNFKTPVLSLLQNTHKKIHSEEKNFKCDQCEKAFKNSKQLKNHRRLHRISATTTSKATDKTKSTPHNPEIIHKCLRCGSTYAHAKTLKDHICKVDNFTCSICGKLISSRSAFKLHLLTHEKNSETARHKCDNCQYTTNDHNAFRRHRMIHSQNAKYVCKFCTYKCIQSNLYQRHLLQKHPDVAFEVLFKCSVCSFTTINQANYKVHIAKHEDTQQQQFVNNYSSESLQGGEDNHLNSITPSTSSLPPPPPPLQEIMKSSISNNENYRNKIKVKSDLILTDPTKFCSISNNNLRNIGEGII